MKYVDKPCSITKKLCAPVSFRYGKKTREMKWNEMKKKEENMNYILLYSLRFRLDAGYVYNVVQRNIADSITVDAGAKCRWRAITFDPSRLKWDIRTDERNMVCGAPKSTYILTVHGSHSKVRNIFGLIKSANQPGVYPQSGTDRQRTWVRCCLQQI